MCYNFYKIKEIECLYYSICEGHYGNYMSEKNKMKRKWIFFLSLFFFTEYQRFTLQQSYLSFEDIFIRISYIFLIYKISNKKFKLNRFQADGTFQLSGVAVDCLCKNIGIIKTIANFLKTQESVQIKIWCTVKYMYVWHQSHSKIFWLKLWVPPSPQKLNYNDKRRWINKMVQLPTRFNN